MISSLAMQCIMFSCYYFATEAVTLYTHTYTCTRTIKHQQKHRTLVNLQAAVSLKQIYTSIWKDTFGTEICYITYHCISILIGNDLFSSSKDLPFLALIIYARQRAFTQLPNQLIFSLLYAWKIMHVNWQCDCPVYVCLIGNLLSFTAKKVVCGTQWKTWVTIHWCYLLFSYILV